MPTRRKDLDHVGAYNFAVEIQGITAGAFKAVEGLNCEIEVLEFQDGDDIKLRKRPGRHKYGDITLKKGYIHNVQLQDWWQQIIDGQYVRKSISIILYDNLKKEICRWNLFDCWPKAWKVSGLDGKGNDALTEEITFVTENVIRISK